MGNKLTIQQENFPGKRTDSIQVNRRAFGRLVDDETIEDYALRYSPAEFRTWSEFVVSNTAIGGISFLALEAIGAAIAINYGFQNALWGILTASVIIFILGFPICYQAAKHNLDIDLLTRAAGFGYLGSTVTSLIYASFCFIFFALEAAIMAQAINLYFGLPLSIGYVFCSLIIIPVVYYGMTAISRLQMVTQPIWLILMILPFVMVLMKNPDILDSFHNFSGQVTGDSGFSWQYFGIALGVSLSLIAQIGEQADYLRFMPDKTKENRVRWWLAVILAGPGWTILGFLKQMGGIFLAALVLLGGASLVEAKEPIQMYNAAYHYVFENPEVALLASFIFVIVSQIKINVTNAYAGSLAWSNFFSRATHTHPGRAVWVVFNIAIALLLMLMGVFDVLEKILGLYSNVAIAWVATIFADLVINKPTGLSPPVIDFRRAYLFNINPVGTISTLLASVLAIIAFSGVLGPELQAFSSIIALVTALVLTPLIAWLTKGRYYIARQEDAFDDGQHYCGVCQNEFSAADMAACPMHASNICSLCCSVEARCHDMCKTKEEFSIKGKVLDWLDVLSNGKIGAEKTSTIIGFLLIFFGLLTITSFLLWTSYIVQIIDSDPAFLESVRNTYTNIFYLLALILFVGSWLIVLMQESRAYVETERKNAKIELSAKEAQLRMALENMPGAMIVVDSDLQVTSVNDAYRDFFGDRDGLVRPGASMREILKAEIAQGLLSGEGTPEEILDERVQSFKSGSDVTFEDRSPDGRYFQLSRRSAGKDHTVSVAVDITDRKQAENDLKEQSSRVDLLQKTAADANKAANLDDAIRSCLGRITEHTGWPIGHACVLSADNRNVLVPSGIWHLNDPERFSEFVKATEATTFDSGVGLPGRVLEFGEPAWIVDVTKDPNFPRAGLAEDAGLYGALAFPVTADEQVVAVLEFFDEKADEPDESLLATVAHVGEQLGRVFKRDQNEREIRLARDAAEEATRAKASFLAAMSHEIRTPMGGVIGMIDLLQQTRLDDDQHHMTSTVRNSANSLLTIINDILDFSKIEAGKLDLEEVPISVRDAVEGVGEALAVNARNKNIGLSVFVDPDIPDAVLGDQVRVRQILFNLGGNAVKFTETGKVLIRADRLPSDDKDRATIRFSIIDDGIGIPEEAQANLFAAFSQVEASTTRRFGGTGLGLSICQRLTELMAGEIGVDSEVGQGSTFHATLSFPVADTPSIKSDGLDLGGLKVLLAIEDDDMREITPRYLEHWKAEVVAIPEVDDIEETALAAASDGGPFDVIGLISKRSLASQIELVERLNASRDIPSKRFVIACAGRDRSERKAVENTLYIDTDPLIREKFIRTISAAAGRTSPDIIYEEEDAPTTKAKAPGIAEAEAAGQLVLFAEDNLTNQDVIGRQLNLLGYAFEVASDGREALEMFQAKSYSILLTDCHMPVMDGFELAKNIRELEKDKVGRFPIVAITASVMKEEIDGCFAAGMDDYLPKPLELPKLRDMLRKRMPETGRVVSAEPDNIEPEVVETDTVSGEGPIDPSALKSVFGDDDETFREILGDFIGPAGTNVDEIISAAAEGSSKDVGTAAHKLKSSSRAIGAASLADACQALETAGHEDDRETINRVAPTLPALFAEIKSYIENL
jgi:PAS domain S-box-containing protein